MSDLPDNPTAAGRRMTMVIILREALFVVLAGLAVSLVANGLSPQGLTLSKNYFPGGNASSISPPSKAGTTNQPSADDPLTSQIKSRGLHVVNYDQASRLFHDPRFQQGMVVFLDARDEGHYQAGHVPGAYEFDAYRTEKYFTAVFPVCQAAEEIVVYCNGGDCEDSQFAAIALRDAGIANQKLFVYTGGISDWATNGLPVETGGRNSGDLSRREK